MVLEFPEELLLLLLLEGAGWGGGLLLIGPLWVYGGLEILLVCCTFGWTAYSTTADLELFSTTVFLVLVYYVEPVPNKDADFCRAGLASY